jgi:hypothetical protein
VGADLANVLEVNVFGHELRTRNSNGYKRFAEDLVGHPEAITRNRGPRASQSLPRAKRRGMDVLGLSYD